MRRNILFLIQLREPFTPEPERTPNRKILSAKRITPNAVNAKTEEDSSSSHNGGSDGKRMIAANGAESGNQLKKASNELSGESNPNGIINMQAVSNRVTGVVRVCASCMDSAKAPIAIKKAP